MSRPVEALLWQEYLAARAAADADWKRVARLSELVAAEFTGNKPHGGDLEALQLAFSSATSKTRDAVEKYRQFLEHQP